MQLIYFDLRGHGRSARDDSARYTLDEHVEDTEALRRHLGLGPIVSIGTSYGGRVAMAHAARYPSSVSHLILIGTSAHGGSLKRAEEIVAERGTPEQVAICKDLHAGRLDTPEKMRRYYDLTAALYAHASAQKCQPTTAAAILSPEAQNRAFGPGGFMRTLDLRPELHLIVAPTLILVGRHDWRCAPEFSEELHALIPHSDLRIFENSGHSIARDEPELCLDAIAGFLAYNTSARHEQR
jgi:proline iminopeptidase